MLDCINCSTLFSYCSVGKITSKFPLSARVIMAFLSVSFVFYFQDDLRIKMCVVCAWESVVLL